MYSAVILTFNEEKALPDCLASLRGCDDIVVLDSGSSDQTVPIAESSGARVYIRTFDNFADQRNYAQHEIRFRHPWVFHLDADERMTTGLAEECRRASVRTDLDGFRVAPKMIFMGRWIPHCTDYPAFQARFVRAPEFTFIQVGHGQREAPGMRLENMSESYLHDMTIHGGESWLAKHRNYAKMEAMARLQDDGDAPWRQVFSSDPLTRRRALKRLSFVLPFRPLSRFAYQYFLRLGFLDGRAGLSYCLLLARYEGFIEHEIRTSKGTT